MRYSGRKLRQVGDPDRMREVAEHRLVSGRENTLAGLRCGLAYGFRAAEFDVMLSADGVPVPVLMHDLAFGRTVQGIGMCRRPARNCWPTMDAGSWFAPRFAGEPVPSFADVIAFCSREGIWMNAEIKPPPGYAAETGRAAAALLKQMLAEDSIMAMPLFSSFSPEEPGVFLK